MKGILFKPDMIKAIQEGRKTQTRGVAGLKEINEEPDEWILAPRDPLFSPSFWIFDAAEKRIMVKPRYQVGDVVYIKEAYLAMPWGDIMYPLYLQKPSKVWQSPMFMPQKYARYFIQITDVNPERLQEITNRDVFAEGLNRTYLPLAGIDGTEVFHFGDYPTPNIYDSPVGAYAHLWDSINKKNTWSTNSWVWVYTFKKSEKQS